MSATDLAAHAAPHLPRALRVRRALLRALGSLTLVATLAVLPLVVLIRGGLFLDRVLAWNAWLSIGLAAVASLCVIDERLVLTDIRRTPEGYRRMSLPVALHSSHYLQPDGFVHAIDLRTRGHGAPRNLLTQAWFLALGFETLRHSGSADHLHVALPPLGER